MDSNMNTVWIFGYGSLMWNPGFNYECSKIGCIRGFARRFWQGNVTHRGTLENPGLVATLIENEKEEVWGVAYKVSGKQQIEEALDHLDIRENILGGYKTFIGDFFPKDNTEFLSVIIHIAISENKLYCGPAPLDKIAKQIIASKGPCGHNVEYLVRTAEFVRENIPWVNDSHLFQLDGLVKKLLKQKNICLKSLLEKSSLIANKHTTIESKLSYLLQVKA